MAQFIEVTCYGDLPSQFGDTVNADPATELETFILNLGATPTVSGLLKSGTKLIVMRPNADCRVAIGANPSASRVTPKTRQLKANEDHRFILTQPGSKISAVLHELASDTTAPTISTGNSFSVLEGVTLAIPLTADETIASWTITGGVDQAEFTISNAILTWVGNGVKDHVNPDDSDGDNIYVVQVTATDAGGNTANLAIAITVQSADTAAPTITNAPSYSVVEGQTLNIALTANENVTWTIVGGLDTSQFENVGATLRWNLNGVKNYNAPTDSNADNVYNVLVRATDDHGNFSTRGIDVTVTEAATRLVGQALTWPNTFDRVVYTEAELRTAISDIGTSLPQGAVIGVGADIDLGNTNRATGGFVDKTLYIKDKSCTIVPDIAPTAADQDYNPMGDGLDYVQCFKRKRKLHGFITATATGTRRTVIIKGFDRTLNAFPPQGDQISGQTWWDIGCTYRGDGTVEAQNNAVFALTSFMNNVDFQYDGNEAYMGSDLSHTPLDPRNKVIDMNSPTFWKFVTGGIDVGTTGDNPGHGDTVWIKYNRLITGPRGVFIDNWTGANGQLHGNVFRDLMTGYKSFASGNASGAGVRQTLTVKFNLFNRNYTDDSQSSQVPGANSVMRRYGNIYGPGVGNSRDNANPHGDREQYFMAQSAGGVERRIAHHRTYSEVQYSSYRDRRSAASLYYQGGGALYNQIGWEMHNIIAFNCTKMFAMTSGSHTLLRNMVGVNQNQARTNDANAPGFGNLQFQRAGNGAGAPLADSMSIVENVIHEGFYRTSGGYSRQYKRINYKDMPKWGAAGRAAAQAAEFSNIDREIESANDAFLAVTQKAVGGSNILTGFANMADFLEAAQPDIAICAFAEMIDLSLNTQYEFDAYLFGVEGSARTIGDMPAGLEAKVVDAITQADITTYSTTTFAAQAGQLLRIRLTTPNSPLVQTVKTIQLNGANIDITYSTMDTALYPLARFAGTTAIQKTTGGIGSVDTTKMSLFFDFVFKQTNTTQNIFLVATGTNISITTTANESISFLFRVSGATQASFSTASASLVDGQRYRIHLMIDTTQDDVLDAVRMWINGFEYVNTTPAYTKNGVLKFGLTTAYNLMGSFAGDLYAFIVWPDHVIDWSDYNLRKKTSPTLIGSDGSGIDGTPAKIFLKGDASILNGASTANLGTGGAFDNTGTDVVQL